MDVCPDYEDLFKKLNAHKIKYLVFGAHAVVYYTEPRYTKDIDVCISANMNNVQKIWDALKDFGAPLKSLKSEDFLNEKLIYQIGVAPIRIDIMGRILGLDFKTAWKNKKRVQYGKTPIYILGLGDLVKSKKKSGRRQDLLDLENLSRKKRTP